MVDVSAKGATERVAIAEGRVVMRKETLDVVLEGNAMGAARDWFVDAPRGDMRLKPGVTKAGNAGVVDWRFTGR